LRWVVNGGPDMIVSRNVSIFGVKIDTFEGHVDGIDMLSADLPFSRTHP